VELWSYSNELWLWIWVIRVTQRGVVGWVVDVALAVDDILLMLWLSKLLFLLWLSRVILLQLNGLQLLWLNSLLLLAQDTVGCQLPDGEATSGVLWEVQQMWTIYSL
jgi:hypothetical protein